MTKDRPMDVQAGTRPGRLRPLLAALVSAVVLTYAGLRAAKVPITFDEAATYISYLTSNVLAVFDLRSANDHLLYSLLARLFTAVGGPREVILRLPSLLGQGLYLAYSWRLLDRFLGGWPALAGFVVLNANLYLLDFFALARGYGLALGFEMTALYYFLVFLDTERKAGGPGRALGMSLGAAVVSALANLSFLVVMAGLWLFALLFSIVKSRPGRPTGVSAASPGIGVAPGGKLLAAVLALSLPVNLVIAAECLRLSDRLIVPIAVAVRGPDPAELQRLIVCGDDTYETEIEFTPGDGSWSLPGTVPLKRLKLGFTDAALARLQGVEIAIGTTADRLSLEELRTWPRLRREGLEYFLSPAGFGEKPTVFRDLRGVLNWKGDDVFLTVYAGEAALVIGLCALFLGLAFGFGRFARRLRSLDRPEFRALVNSACLAALYLAYPIYVMGKSGAFYYGGDRGLIKDTLASLISDSFYGIRYAARQEAAASLVLRITVALFVLIMVLLALRKKSLRDHREALSLAAVMGIIPFLVVAQHALLRTPYIMGRTAVFFIPLYALFLLFFLRDIGRLGRAGRAISALLLAGLMVLSAAHAVRAGNFTHTQDWKIEADTRAAIRAVAADHAPDPEGLDRLRLGVDWRSWPAAEYYRREYRLVWLDISKLPTTRHCDLFYLYPDNPQLGRHPVIRTFPLTGTVLAR